MAGNIHRSSANLPDSFQDGYLQFTKMNYAAALSYFQRTCDKASRTDPRRHKFDSYYGLCKVLLGDTSGLVVCRRAAEQEGFDGDVFANLALAEFHMNCRRRAFGALEKGIRIDPYLTRLRLIFNKMDRRRPPVFGFLSRSNFINRHAGKMLYTMKLLFSRSKSAGSDDAIMDLCLSKRTMF